LTDAHHEPVLLRETLELLEPARGGLFVDCTLGLGGHAEALLSASPEIRLVGVDRDPQALDLARRRLEPYGDRVLYAESDYRDLDAVFDRLDLGKAAGILADLGVSSLQLDRAERGFSFQREGPLDMRMGARGPTAADIVNDTPEADLTQLFKTYGEEPQARRIARRLVEVREERPFETTTELAEAVSAAKGPGRPGDRRGRRKTHPATQVFQALRIAVNDELAGLERFLDAAVGLLEVEGRLVVLSYHSLEDRIVKHRLRDLDRGEVDPITGRPRAETRLIEVLTKKPVRPSAPEVEANPRSRSARLRAARRL
jgi:16S rRNA (cytosine1402-N4)-methyltransferase